MNSKYREKLRAIAIQKTCPALRSMISRGEACDAAIETAEALEKILLEDAVVFETTWGRVKCHDADSVIFPRFMGDGLYSQLQGKKWKVICVEIEETAKAHADELPHLGRESVKGDLKVLMAACKASIELYNYLHTIGHAFPSDAWPMLDAQRDALRKVVELNQAAGDKELG